jgi:hypothetical protein
MKATKKVPLPKDQRAALPDGLRTSCVHCLRENEPARTHCDYCGERLRSTCGHCGHSNRRGAKKCEHCGKALRASLWRRWRRKLFRKKGKLKLVHIVLLIILGFFAGYLLPKWLSSMESVDHSSNEAE